MISAYWHGPVNLSAEWQEKQRQGEPVCQMVVKTVGGWIGKNFFLEDSGDIGISAQHVEPF